VAEFRLHDKDNDGKLNIEELELERLTSISLMVENLIILGVCCAIISKAKLMFLI